MKVTVKANTNIALVKYWGKKDENLKIPLNNSISMTLDKLYTITTSDISDNDQDQVIFNNKEASEISKNKIIKFVDIFRNQYKRKEKLIIKTENNFPTASGLASSASGFAALAKSINEVFDLNLSDIELSKYARIGSGSACRSIYGGFVEWQKGKKDNGEDSYAIQLVKENYWDVRMMVVIIDDKQKDKSSTDGMKETVETSPFYPAWLDTIDNDLNNVRQGILDKDLEKVGITMEHNCLKMHSTMFTTRPAIIYWKPATLAVINKVYELRKSGIQCYFTMDAGPNVKILYEQNNSEKIKKEIMSISEITNLIECKVGSSALII